MINIDTLLSDYILFDLETTGLSTENDQVVEISALKITDGKITDEFSTLVNPGIHIPYQASSINGITDDMVKEAPDMEHALKDFISFIGDSILVGHNIKRFDLGFIQRDAVRYFGRQLTNGYVDTLILSRKYLPDLYSHSLCSLADHYDISYEGAHRALADCHINKQVYDCLKKEIEDPSDAVRQMRTCPVCGNVMKKRNGKYGEFWGCTGFPDCRYTQDC
ncbi:MAG: topoisomerase DNA-binding C4 zinc finger domain-containing protein [Clostridiales bacterium]|nr:topoisomerase DNA-binding C4 zinc finger domain-containing protein [Clostridiales bacterium]